MRARREAPILLTATILATLFAMPAGAASGPVGSLAFLGCLRDPISSSPCATVGTGLRQGVGTVVSPSGEFVYTTAWTTTGAVNVFRRYADGGLTQIDSTGGTTLGRASGIAITADGANLYVASYGSSALTVFQITEAGTLLQLQCFSENVTAGCTQVQSLAGAFGIAISPDGKNVYVASNVDGTSSGTLGIFQRQSDGILTFGSCYKQLGSTGDDGCAQLAGITGARSVAVSPDGGNVYVAASGSPPSGTVMTFTRNLDGSLLSTGCFRETGSAGPAACTPIAGLNEASAVTVSGDGANVYAASYRNGAIVSFARDAAGALTPLACLREAGVSGDAECAPADGLGSSTWVVVSGDGANVYSTGEGSLIAALVRNPDGTVSPSSCVRDVTHTGDPSCTSVIGLGGAESLALSPDGAYAYVATFINGEVTSFVRQAPPSCADTSISATGGVPVSVPTSCSDPNGDAVTVTVAGEPAHGTVVGPAAGGVFTYTAALGYGGADAFTFRASDGSVNSRVATVSLDVSASTPEVSSFVASPAKFRVARAAPSRSKTARGTTFQFALSEPATASIEVASIRKGRLENGICVKPTAKLRKAERCILLVRVGTLDASGVTGANSVIFTGRFNSAALRPGPYEAAIVATNAAGRSSASHSVTFKVVKGR
jgi:DNA-binding beta-propeller fold protein YncE